jgi:hypothetical protein
MKKKTAKQLDREIDEALSQGRYFALVNRPWWIWQQAALTDREGEPIMKVKKVELPWAYDWKGLSEGQPFAREHISSLGFKNMSKLRALPRRFGSMLVVEVTGPGMRRMLTPPLHMFANLSKIDPQLDLSSIGSARFWIQPEIFQVTHGELYQGDNVRDLLDVDRDALSEAPDQRAVNAVLVALDAYLEADKPDRRFV